MDENKRNWARTQQQQQQRHWEETHEAARTRKKRNIFLKKKERARREPKRETARYTEEDQTRRKIEVRVALARTQRTPIQKRHTHKKWKYCIFLGLATKHTALAIRRMNKILTTFTGTQYIDATIYQLSRYFSPFHRKCYYHYFRSYKKTHKCLFNQYSVSLRMHFIHLLCVLYSIYLHQIRSLQILYTKSMASFKSYKRRILSLSHRLNDIKHLFWKTYSGVVFVCYFSNSK